jgi:hypothetical protein
MKQRQSLDHKGHEGHKGGQQLQHEGHKGLEGKSKPNSRRPTREVLFAYAFLRSCDVALSISFVSFVFFVVNAFRFQE